MNTELESLNIREHTLLAKRLCALYGQYQTALNKRDYDDLTTIRAQERRTLDRLLISGAKEQKLVKWSAIQ